MKRLLDLLLLLGCASAPRGAREETGASALTPCTHCVRWNEPHAAVPIYGNTYYVGTTGLGSVLITSPEGHVLIDGALNESAPLIEANVAALGFRMADVRLILNSHAHFDHAGGIAASHAGPTSESLFRRIGTAGDAAWVASTQRVGTADTAERLVMRRTPEGWRVTAVHWS